MITDPYPFRRFHNRDVKSSFGMRNRAGFTLVEVLVSSLILAISTIIICQLCRHCINNHLLIGEYQCAYQLADEIFERVLASELPLPTQPDILMGDFAPSHPDYAWSLTIKPARDKNLYDLAVTVSWTAREQQYHITTATLMYDFLERPGVTTPIAGTGRRPPAVAFSTTAFAFAPAPFKSHGDAMSVDAKINPFMRDRHSGCGAAPPSTGRKNVSAFTLVEILITLIIGTLIATIALAGYQTVAALRHKIMIRSQQQAELHYAVNRIRNDLANFYRGGQAGRMVLTGAKIQTDAGRADRLTFHAVFDPPFRPVYPAGDLYQIEYALSASPQTNQNVLSRRAGAIFSTAPPEFAVTTDRLIGRLKSLQFDYFYQDAWYDQWLRTDAIPMMIRVTLAVDKTDPISEEAQPITRVISLEPFPKQLIQPEPAVSTPSQAVQIP